MKTKQRLSSLSIFLICILTAFASFGQTTSKTSKKVKIACVGNSITYGSRVTNREKNAYPVQLQYMLGADYEVENFGVSGATLLQKGDKPYWQTDAYLKALRYAPDIVFIKLGTNDSKAQNRIFLDGFQDDYTKLIQKFKTKNPQTRIVLLLPLPSFAKDSTKIWNPVIRDEIIPSIQKVAYRTKTEVIDLHQMFIDRADLLPDKIHPSGLGASLIAQRLYEVVLGNSTDINIQLGNKNDIVVGEEANFYGFTLTNFKYKGIDCKLARPKKIAKGMPWVWRARFWGHEPQTDIALLERGFHIAYCDVTDLYGNQEAVERWDNFYGLMTKTGLSKKVALEGMSRGGLIIYNWAEQNSDKVACIYADAPVLDGKSWPGGLKKGNGSPDNWERFKKVYGLKNDSEVETFQGNPIHKTKSIARGGYPMLHVCGETDKVVPMAENTVPFEKAILAHGGQLETIAKPNNGHHPHSLENPKPIVDFILRATGQKLNFAVVASPSAEYRSAAGWTEGSDWWTQATDIDSICKASENVDLLLIGNSITQSFGGNRPHVTGHSGKEATAKCFKDLKWVNAGISGDRTQHMLWRLQNGNYEKAEPKTVVLTIGVNNFSFENTEEIFEGIKLVLHAAKKKFSKSNIILFGPLPTGTNPDSKQRKKYNALHDKISGLPFDDKLSYHEISAFYIDAEGNLNENLYSEDGIHLKPEGYKVWAEYIHEQINEN
mgnify:CR=1 FL=1